MRFSAIKSLHFLAFAAVALGGCGLGGNQRDALGTFGQSAAALGEAAKPQLLQARADVIDMDARILALRPGITNSGLQGSPQRNDGAFTAEAVGVRIRVVEAIESYGKLLTEFAGDESAAEIRAAGDDLVAKLRGVAPEAGPSAAQMDDIARLVQSGLQLYVNNWKARKLREIVPKMDPVAGKLGCLFADEFRPRPRVGRDPDDLLRAAQLCEAAVPGWQQRANNEAALALNLRNTGELAGRAAEDVLRRPGSEFALREAAAETRTRSIAVEARADTVFRAIGDSSYRMVAAHRALRESLLDSDTSIADIKAFGKSVADMATAARALAASRPQ